MKIRSILFISVLLSATIPTRVSAQEQASIDSLISLLESTDGQDHLKILNELSENRWLSLEDRLSYAEDAIDYAARSGEIKWLYDAHLHQGRIYSREAMDQEALESFEKALNISEESGLINVIDLKEKAIFRFDRQANLQEKIDSVNGHPLNEPEEFLHNEVHDRLWLIDGTDKMDYIFTKNTGDSIYTCVDSLYNAGNIEADKSADFVWIVSYAGINSLILQLSGNGIRTPCSLLTSISNTLNSAPCGIGCISCAMPR